MRDEIRPLETECENTGELVRLVFEGDERRPYLMNVSCPACSDTWTETGNEAEIARILAL